MSSSGNLVIKMKAEQPVIGFFREEKSFVQKQANPMLS